MERLKKENSIKNGWWYDIDISIAISLSFPVMNNKKETQYLIWNMNIFTVCLTINHRTFLARQEIKLINIHRNEYIINKCEKVCGMDDQILLRCIFWKNN